MTEGQLERAEIVYEEFLGLFEEAIELAFVDKPISYALYQLWKKYDSKEKSRNIGL